MTKEPRPWEWRRALWSRPGEVVPEKTIIFSVTCMAFGLILLVGILFFGAGIDAPGVGRQYLAALFVAAFLLIGAFGVRMGIRQHRYRGRVVKPRRNARAR